MRVRFVSAGGGGHRTNERDRTNLAEVIDLRSRLVSQTAVTPESRRSTEQASGDVFETRDLSEDAVRILARRALSAAELRDRLTQLGHAINDIEQLIESFVERHYLDDDSLARTLCEKLRTSKRASRAEIRRQLASRGLTAASIETALADLDVADDEELLYEIARDRATRLTSLDREVATRRLYGFLARRGWSGASLTRIISEVLDEAFGEAR